MNPQAIALFMIGKDPFPKVYISVIENIVFFIAMLAINYAMFKFGEARGFDDAIEQVESVYGLDLKCIQNDREVKKNCLVNHGEKF